MDRSPVNSGYGYQGYGYELADLLNRYGVPSPVAPRQGDLSDEEYQALLRNYQKTIHSTPMYNVPIGNQTYQDLTHNVQYGDPKGYFETRGLTDPFAQYKAIDVFGWKPHQVDASLGRPPGSTQNWIDNNITPVQQPSPYGPPQVNKPVPSTHQDYVNSVLNDEKLTGVDKVRILAGYANTHDLDVDTMSQLTGRSVPVVIRELTRPSTGYSIPGMDKYYSAPPKAQGFADGGLVDDELEALLSQYGVGEDGSPLTTIEISEGNGPVMEDVPTGMEDLIARYLTREEEANDDLLAAQMRSRGARLDIRDEIEQMASEEGSKPSKAELWWRLAAAFANPGRTGSFGEGLGHAATAAADHMRSVRQAESQNKAIQRELKLKGLEVGADMADTDLETARRRAETAGTNARQVVTTAIGRQAANSRMSAGETKALLETQDVLDAGSNALISLNEALKLNPNTYGNSLMDRAQYRAARAVGSKEDKVVNTAVLENLLTGQALESLRATFGAAPTEGERKILLDIQGIGAASIEERERIITRAIQMIKRRMEAARERQRSLKAGEYRNYEVYEEESDATE